MEPAPPLPGYWATAEYHARVLLFLRAADPLSYGHPLPAKAKPTASQLAAIAAAASAIQSAAMAMAVSSPDGLLAAEFDPCTYGPTHPSNVWALEHRMRAERREVELPLLGLTLRVRQRHWSEDASSGASGFELHTTGGLCWDGAVVLADFLTHPPAVLASHSPALARAASSRPWSWEGRYVVELGCGAAPLPSFAAALCGARAVLATDGSPFCVEMAERNAAEFGERFAGGREGAPVAEVRVRELRWGEGAEAELLRAHGFPPAADVVLCADGLYVLGNRGAWGALLRTLRALTGASGFAVLTYTERGAARQFCAFLDRASSAGFRVVEAGEHLLHASSRQGAVGRLEQHVGDTRVFLLSPAEPSAAPREAAQRAGAAGGEGGGGGGASLL